MAGARVPLCAAERSSVATNARRSPYDEHFDGTLTTEIVTVPSASGRLSATRRPFCRRRPCERALRVRFEQL